MGDFQPVCDIVLNYFVISVCVPSKTLHFLLLVVFFCCCFFNLVCNFEILFHVRSVFYKFSPALVLGD